MRCNTSTITKNGNVQVSRFNPVDEGEMGVSNNYATFATEAIFDSNHTVRRGGLRIDGGNDTQVSRASIQENIIVKLK